jgi:hypothetical protein
MNERRVPTDAELRSWLLAKIDDLRQAMIAAAGVEMHEDQRAEYERLQKALADLESRAKESLADDDRPRKK